MKFIGIIAFVITAVGYWLYKINRQQQPTRREESRQHVTNSPSSLVQRSTKQGLVLVVSALHTDFLESLKVKEYIDLSDGEELYKITKYLLLGSKVELWSQIQASINQYSVLKGKESEYDIYLVYTELKQADEGFKSNVNQLDRYDAFRKLADLGVNLKVSPRLQMEAYGNTEVYSR